ncbi:Protein SABRE [Capsicum baccatum]|uniref:Protein SABRE n=1 Tax=Capsicum baccatum TaxID=33114 RepID=A0A2G2WF54_CAPBA|nr:Protein SABRE [Capsicum baccatum]
MHFMPKGRFLLAAVSGRVLARSFHSVLSIGYEVIKQALGGGNVQIRESQPEMTWNHGVLCDVKPLKELSFNSHNITATMTSRQLQVMLDVLTNLLFARLPKPQKVRLSYPAGDDEDVEEEADEVVPDGVEEVELARVNLEQKERVQKLIQDDIRKLSLYNDESADRNSVKEDDLWIISGGRSILLYDFDRDYKDVGVAKFTTKYFVVRNCLQNAKSHMLLSAWNTPEWGKRVMLRVDAKQGAPKDGNYPLELFQVEIYPLKIHLTETMYRMMWEYFFPEEEQDSQRWQEVWKFSTTAGSRRTGKGSSIQEAPMSSSHLTKDPQVSAKSSTSALPVTSANQFSSSADSSQNLKATIVCGSTSELRRTSSIDRTWEENVADELMLQMHSSSAAASTNGPFAGVEQPDEGNRTKSKESKLIKSGRSSHEEKKVGKAQDEKKSRPRRMREFHNIKISQVELLVTYEGSRFAGKKFKDKAHNQKQACAEQNPLSWPKRPAVGAGDGFVTSIKGPFNSQRQKAKAFVLRTMRGEAENEITGDWSESEAEFSPFARQLTITKAKKMIRRHTKKFHSRGPKGLSSQQRESLPSSPRETTPFESDSSSGSSPYEDFHE